MNSPMNTEPIQDYSDLQHRLEGVMRRLCPPWLRGDLDDLVQAAQLKIYRRGDSLTELESSFLYRVGHSVMVDEIRRVKRRREVRSQDVVENARGTEVDPEVAAAGHELGQTIHLCLAELKPEYRRAVSLHLHGHSVPEIATLLGIDKKKADNLVYRGVSRLREALNRRGLP